MNKVETKVTIEVDVDTLPLPDDRRQKIRERLASRINRAGVLRVTSQVARTQSDNRDRALTRMEELLRESLVEQAPRRKTRVSEGDEAEAAGGEKAAGGDEEVTGTDRVGGNTRVGGVRSAVSSLPR